MSFLKQRREEDERLELFRQWAHDDVEIRKQEQEAHQRQKEAVRRLLEVCADMRLAGAEFRQAFNAALDEGIIGL